MLFLTRGCGGEEDPAPTGPTYDAEGRLLRRVARPARPPNLVLVVIDTLRGDALPLGEEAPGAGSMPFLADLASRAVAFRDATAPAAWTLPSMATLLTGLQPSEHGCDDIRETRPLADAITTYAEALREGHGYETAAFVGGPWFGWGRGLLQGFTVTNQAFALQGTEAMVGRWLDVRDPDRPFFLLLHTFEAHDPYGEANHAWPAGPDVPVVPEGMDPAAIDDPAAWTRAFFLDRGLRAAFERAHGLPYVRGVVRYIHSGWRARPDAALARDLREAYDGGVRWVDGLLERAVAFLDARGLLEDTLLVVTSDHGEAFGEHGILAHGRQLYDELVRVPLVMVGPPPFQGGRVLAGGIGLVDVMPTYFAWAGLPPIEGVAGRSMLGFVEGREPGRPVVSEERVNEGNAAEEGEAARFSVRTPRWKYVVTHDLLGGAAIEELYDLAADPTEGRDLAAPHGRVPPRTDLPPAFCEAVEAVRARIWGPRGSRPRGPRPAPSRPAPCGALPD